MDKLDNINSNIGSAAARKRQQMLSDILAPSTEAFIRQFQLGDKKKVLDLGCGNGATTLMLCTMMGPKSQITGLGVNQLQLQLARKKADQEELHNIAFRHQNPLEWKEEQAYDLVYSRHFFDQFAAPLNLLQKAFDSLEWDFLHKVMGKNQFW